MFKRREEGLKKKDLELQESLIRFSKFLQENDAKRMHALKKALDEKKTREEKEREIEQLVRGYLVQLASSSVTDIAISAHINEMSFDLRDKSLICAQSLPFRALLWEARDEAKHQYINRLPSAFLTTQT